jgi:hypothetical protein
MTCNLTNVFTVPLHCFSLFQVTEAGGSPVENILWRFGITHGLSFMLFRDTHPYPESTLRQKLVTSGITQYNVMTENSVYDATALRDLMPNNTIHVAIVRDQLSHLRSVLRSFDIQNRWDLTERVHDPVRIFLQNPYFYSQFAESPLLQNTQNRMAYEFGYKEWHYQYPPGDFEEYMEYLDEQFKLVLVHDHFHESLVLLRRYFCWKTKDILYLPVHEASHKDESWESRELELSRAARDWSSTDAAIYDFFAARLLEQLRAQPDDVSDEATWFAQVVSTTASFCRRLCTSLLISQKNKGTNRTEASIAKHMKEALEQQFAVEESPWDPGFTMTGEDCVSMALSPDVYRALEFSRQFPEICGAEPSEQVTKLARELHFDRLYCIKTGETLLGSIIEQHKDSLADILPFCAQGY